MKPSRVLIVGVGGLGCPGALALARAGVAHLSLMDPDLVELSNLHRQPWYRTADVGRPKAHAATDRLRAAFPALTFEPRVERLDAQTADALFQAHDAVFDGTDGTAIKFVLSDAAVRTGRPLVYGGVLRFTGQAWAIRPGGPCLRCLFEQAPAEDEIPTCAQAGVLGSLASLVGATQAALLLGTEDRLWRFDARTFSQRLVRVSRRADCQACGGHPVPAAPSERACPS